jgi:hypothetical protein
MYKLNNTISCIVRKDRILYSAEKKLNFGVQGTMGTSQTLVINFVGSYTAITAGDTETAYEL